MGSLRTNTPQALFLDGLKVLMDRDHRERIQADADRASLYLEWGGGGSTLWLDRHLAPTVAMVSVEHDRAWHEKVSARTGRRVESRLLEPSATAPRLNANWAEENPEGLQAYVRQPDHPDVILVDGVARHACIVWAFHHMLTRGAILYLHDSQRAWYLAAFLLPWARIQHFASGQTDYPGPELTRFVR